MKVALVSAFCLESSMPLAKHLAEEKVEVHLYGIIPHYNQNVYVANFSKNKQPCGFIQQEIAVNEMGENLIQYLGGIETRFYVYPGGAGKRSYFPDIYYAWIFAKELIKKKFDVIHLIHTGNRFSLLLLKLLKNRNVIQTLHEVTAHDGETSKINIKILNTLIKNSVPIIFNSAVSKNRFLSYSRTLVKNMPVNESNYKMIRFGLFEIYNQNTKKLPSENSDKCSIPVILHFGRIVKYKGIDILLEAVRVIQKSQAVHLIVAGDGKPYFNFEGINSYDFFNYPLDNDELTSLIKRATVVVCPYTSASQSGIPMTVYLFSKPIIASNVGGFEEVIEDRVTGMLVDKLDADSFAGAIQYIIKNKDIENEMVKEIKAKYTQGEFEWSYIARQTKNFYQERFGILG